MEDVDVAAIDRWADARLEYHRAKYRALWGPHAPVPDNVTENIANIATLEEIARTLSTAPTNEPLCERGPSALCVKHRGVTFWASLENRKIQAGEAV